jgi:hypothetical protein
MFAHDDKYDRGVTTDLMAEARAMRDETVARWLAAAWHDCRGMASRLLHSAPPPKAGHPHPR